MAILFKNNAASTLTYKMTDVQEVLYVADASVFPVIASDSGDVFKLTLVGDDTLEIVEAFEVYNPEGRQGFKIRRAQEGTTAQAWPAGTRVEMRITADALNSFVPTAVQLAKDYVDATGVASTTNVGFAGVDGKTTQSDAGGVITAKDVAIGGDLGDLASARGQIGELKVATATEYPSILTIRKSCRLYFNGTEWAQVADRPFEAGYGAVVIADVSSGALRGEIWAFSLSGNDAWKAQFNEKGTSPFARFVMSNAIGDGIRVTNGIISVPEMQGATASASGTSGLVPPAAAGQHESFLTGGGEYKPALTKISDSVNLADSKTAASAKAVKAAYDRGTDGVTAANGKLSLSGGVMSGRIGGLRGNYNADASSRYATGALEIRENGGVGSAQSDIAYAPTIGFHWANKVAGLLALRSDGIFTFLKQNGTRAVVDCDVPYATAANKLRREGGVDTSWYWNGQGGQPQWLWGGNDGESMYVYNPSNFSVNYANSANYATTAGSANNASTAWQTTIVPNVTFVGRGGTMPAGGSWLYIYIPYDRHFLTSMTLAGGAGAPDNDGGIAIKVG